MAKNSNIIVFAQSASERDFLRNVLSEQQDRRILCFESETTCFDNLAYIEPFAVVLRTDSRITAWRFIFALQSLKIDAPVLILSNVLNAGTFVLHGMSVRVKCFPIEIDKQDLGQLIRQGIGMADRSLDPFAENELFVGETAFVRSINASLPTLAASADPVLITGEKGTGKELLARMIVQYAGKESLFVKLDCDRIEPEFLTKGLLLGNGDLEKACGRFQDEESPPPSATVLLHKINRLNETTQSEILFLLDHGNGDRPYGNKRMPVGYRIIATSEFDLSDMVRRSCFRKDLYYRLNVLPVFLPPLQHRKDDIPLLVDYFIIAACVKMNRCFSAPSAWSRNRILDYHWPGNLDELKIAMDRFVNSGDEAQIFAHVGAMAPVKETVDDIYRIFDMETTPDPVEIQSCFRMSGDLSLKSICDRFACRTEKNLMRKALESTNWNRKKAAALLNISYKSMLNKIKMYEIV